MGTSRTKSAKQVGETANLRLPAGLPMQIKGTAIFVFLGGWYYGLVTEHERGRIFANG